jgi:hypothetical protein
MEAVETKQTVDQYDPDEIAQRSDELLKHMIGRPPEPRATPPQTQGRSRKKAASDSKAHDRGKRAPSS